MFDWLTWRVATVFVILATPVLVAVYDLIAYLVAGNEATISRTCLTIAHAHPLFVVVVVFAFGVLVGHLFVPQHVTGK